MLTHRWTRPVTLLLVACLAGCSGGSSGFDIVPEGAAIETALAEGRCVPQPTLQVCPADVPSPGRGPEQIDTAAVRPASCTPDDLVFTCGFAVPFAAVGFPPTAAYRLAVREPAPSRGWAVGLAVMAKGPGVPSADAPVTVEVPAASAAEGITTQFAILVFLDGDGSTPPRVDTLADTGADYAFVTAELVVAVGAP